MPEMILVNPSHRPSKRKATKRVRRAAHKAPARRRNPVRSLVAKTHRRARRRNPIGSVSGGLLKEAGIAGAGAFGVDVLFGQIRAMLPASMQTGLTYAAVKGALTVMAAHYMSNPTARTALKGSLAVQIYAIIASFAGSSLTLGNRGGGMGKYVYTGGALPAGQPGQVSPYPNRRLTAMPGAMARGLGAHVPMTNIRAQINR